MFLPLKYALAILVMIASSRSAGDFSVKLIHFSSFFIYIIPIEINNKKFQACKWSDLSIEQRPIVVCHYDVNRFQLRDPNILL